MENIADLSVASGKTEVNNPISRKISQKRQKNRLEFGTSLKIEEVKNSNHKIPQFAGPIDRPNKLVDHFC